MSQFIRSMFQTATTNNVNDNNINTSKENINQENKEEKVYPASLDENGLRIPITPIPLEEFVEYPQHHVKKQETTTYVGLDLQAITVDDEEGNDDNDRKPLDIAVVIDTSGSMSGNKLEMCKDTIEFMLQQLKSDDRLSLINFGDEVITRELRKMNDKGKQQVLNDLKKIRVSGCTNLSGGLSSGINVLTEIPEKERSEVQAVFLLTDGHANRGQYQTALTISEMTARQMERVPNCRVFTFGYGRDHDPEMLRSIAEYGRGNYYFIRDLDAVASNFADCLGGLLSVVAQNISVTFESNFTENKIMVKNIHGSRTEPTVLVENKKFRLEIGDIYAEEKKNIMVSIELPKEIKDNQLIVRVEGENVIKEFNVGLLILEYIDVLNGNLRTVTVPANITIGENTADDTKIMTKVRNSKMTSAIARLKAKDAMDQAKRSADRNDTKTACDILERVILQITEMRDSVDQDENEIVEEINMLLEDLSTDKSNFSNVAVYRSFGKCSVESRISNMVQQRAQYSPQELSRAADELATEGSMFSKKSKARSKMIGSSVKFMQSKKK